MEFGSFNNLMMANSKPVETPKVGDGATILSWSDRTPATVVFVSENGKTIHIQEDNAVRTDSNGMSECQSYSFTANPSAPVQRARPGRPPDQEGLEDRQGESDSRRQPLEVSRLQLLSSAYTRARESGPFSLISLEPRPSTTMDTMTKTITVRGREYAVTTKGQDYVLTGKRGATYRTMRNKPNPHMMFLVSEKKFTTTTMNDVWLTDKNDKLIALG
jgi:hypothetical protein